MTTTYCNRCSLMCGFLSLPTALVEKMAAEPTKPIKDFDEAIPGTPPGLRETNDLRPYCRLHFIAA